MADEPQGTQTAPAETAPGSAFDEARREIAASVVAQDAPADTTPDAAEPTATTSAETTPAPEDAGEPPDEPKGTRRQRGEEAYQRGLDEGRKLAEAERKAAEDAARAERTAREERESLLSLAQRARAGEWDAVEQLAALTEGRVQATDTQQKELALFVEAEKRVFSKIAQDFASLKGHDGIDEDGFKSLLEAPSVAEYGARAFALGSKSRDAEVTTLTARVRELEGKLSGKAPSPLAANGHTSGGGAPTNLTGMRRAYFEARQELGIGA